MLDISNEFGTLLEQDEFVLIELLGSEWCLGPARDLGFFLGTCSCAFDRAASIGQRIIDEFPNSRMAGEVRELIDTLRERASTVARD